MIDVKVREKMDEMQLKGELPLIEAHIIRPVGPNLMNRDFSNNVKRITYGGTIRTRFSSQSLIKAIRDYRQHYIETSKKEFRTRKITECLIELIKEKDEEKYEELINGISKLKNPKQICVVSKNELENIAGSIISEYETTGTVEFLKPKKEKKDNDAGEEDEDKKKDAKSITTILAENMKKWNIRLSEQRVGDMIALKGRMATDKFIDDIESAVSVNHAYSVDDWAGESDDFSAVDEMQNCFCLDDTEVNNGSALINHTDINANVFYQYANIDTRTLLENCLRGLDVTNEKDLKSAVERMHQLVCDFLADFYSVLPNAKQHSMASVPDPSCMLVTAKKWARPKTADKEFASVIRNENVENTAVKRLSRFADNLINGAFADDDNIKMWWLSDGDITPENAKKCSFREMKSDLIGEV